MIKESDIEYIYSKEELDETDRVLATGFMLDETNSLEQRYKMFRWLEALDYADDQKQTDEN